MSPTTGPANYAQMQHWMEMVIAGAITPTAGTNPYTWTFKRPVVA